MSPRNDPSDTVYSQLKVFIPSNRDYTRVSGKPLSKGLEHDVFEGKNMLCHLSWCGSGWDGRGLAMAAYKQAVFKRSLNKLLAGSVICKQLVDKITGAS